MDKNPASIHARLTEAFAPVLLEITDESARHSGHAGHKAGGGSHLRIRIVSDAFLGVPKLARHRAVYALLAKDMQAGGLHALALDLATVAEAGLQELE